MAEGQDCNLPFMPGQYAAGTDKIEILLPEIPAVLEPFLKGTINAKVTGKKADGTDNGSCLEVNLELEQTNFKKTVSNQFKYSFWIRERHPIVIRQAQHYH